MAKSIQVQITGDTSSLQKAFKSATKDASSFGSKVGSALGTMAKAGALAGVALGVGAVVGMKKAVDAASDLSEQVNKAGVVFGKSGKEVIDWSDGLVTNFGISQRAALEAAGTFGNMLVPMGFTRKAAGDMSQKMVELAGDMSSFNNASPEDTLEAIRAGLAGEAEPLRKFGVFLSDARLKTEALTMGLYDGKGALDANAKASATYALILKDTHDAQGDFARTNEGFANSQRVVAAAWENIQAQLGGLLLPTFAKATTAVAGFLGAFSEADGVSAKFRVVGNSIKDAATATADGLRKAFNSIDWGEVGRTLANGFKQGFNFLVSTVRDVDWGRLGTMVGQALVKEWSTLAKWINSVDWNKAGQAVVAGMGRVFAAFGRFIAGADWGAVAASLGSYLSAALRAIGGLLLGVGTALGQAILKGLRAGLAAEWPKVQAWFGRLPSAVKAQLADAGSWLLSAGAAVLQGFIDGITSKAGELESTLAHYTKMVKFWKGPPAKDKVLLYEAGRLVMGGFIGGIESKEADLRDSLKRQTTAVVGEVNRLQAQLDAVNRRREREDLRSAILQAQQALAEAVKSGNGVAQAEQQLQRAREDVKLAARQKELTTAQTHLDKVQAQFQKAQDAMKATQQKTLDAMQKTLDKARSKAQASFGRLADLVQRGFDAATDAWVAPAQLAINAITDRRAQQDLNEAVSDAQSSLNEALEGGDPEQITDARRTLARALEDIQLGSLQKQAAAEQTAHEQMVAAMQDALDKQLAATGGNMQKIIDVIKKYDGGFAEAGANLGNAFAAALRAAMNAAVADAAAVKVLTGGSSGGSVMGGTLPGAAQFLPGPSKASGGDVNLTVNGWVGNDQALAQKLRNELLAAKRANGNLGLA